MNITVYGLGYVGLPLSKLAKSKGFSVTGVDISEEAVNKAKEEGIESTLDGTAAAKKADTIIICVPTPVDASFMPDLRPVQNACESISKGLKKGQLVVIESTIYPGVTEEVVQPILEKSGLKAGRDFHLAHCPERIDPGNKKWDVSNIPRVVGGIDEASTRKAAEFYRKIIDAEVLELSNVRSAEAAKIMENAFRDINIAFVNEMAKSFDQMNIDVVEVIKAASTKPFGFMAHWPGCGVGGHCIPVDPYYLIEKAKQKGFNHKFLSLAREINNSMPDYTINKLIEGLNEVGKSVKGTHICVLGVAYKRDVDDIRESPAIKIIDKLRRLGAQVDVYDPHVKKHNTLGSLDECMKAECILLVTDHTQYKEVENKLDKTNVRVIIDGRNCLDKNKIKKAGIVYRGIGRNQ